MKIRKQLIDTYLRNITMGRAVAGSDPMSDLSKFDGDIGDMVRAAEIDGVMDLLQISIDALIADPTGRIMQFSGMEYPFDEADLIAVFTYAYQKVWPDDEISDPGFEADLEFVEMSREDWAAYTADA